MDGHVRGAAQEACKGWCTMFGAEALANCRHPTASVLTHGRTPIYNSVLEIVTDVAFLGVVALVGHTHQKVQ
jgi:hypothetical protein